MELIKPGTNIDFVGNRFYAYMFSALLAVLAIMSVPIKGWVQLGVDFTGGVMVQVRFQKTVDIQDIRQALAPMEESVIVQRLAGADEDYIIRMGIPQKETDQLAGQVKQLLENKIGKGTVDIRGMEMVGPKVGKELRDAAIWSTIIALGLLLIYVGLVRFSLSMAIGAILCLAHDVLVIYGIWVWTGKEFNLTILAGMLTIIGYDVNDTVVICDRIRENLPFMRNKPLAEILNASLNQTLSRTILTGSFTLLVVVAMLFVGGDVLNDFAWVIGLGILFGTYSTVFVATPLILAWDRIIPLKRV